MHDPSPYETPILICQLPKEGLSPSRVAVGEHPQLSTGAALPSSGGSREQGGGAKLPHGLQERTGDAGYEIKGTLASDT